MRQPGNRADPTHNRDRQSPGCPCPVPCPTPCTGRGTLALPPVGQPHGGRDGFCTKGPHPHHPSYPAARHTLSTDRLPLLPHNCGGRVTPVPHNVQSVGVLAREGVLPLSPRNKGFVALSSATFLSSSSLAFSHKMDLLLVWTDTVQCHTTICVQARTRDILTLTDLVAIHWCHTS